MQQGKRFIDDRHITVQHREHQIRIVMGTVGISGNIDFGEIIAVIVPQFPDTAECFVRRFSVKIGVFGLSEL